MFMPLIHVMNNMKEVCPKDVLFLIAKELSMGSPLGALCERAESLLLRAE